MWNSISFLMIFIYSRPNLTQADLCHLGGINQQDTADVKDLGEALDLAPQRVNKKKQTSDQWKKMLMQHNIVSQRRKSSQLALKKTSASL